MPAIDLSSVTDWSLIFQETLSSSNLPNLLISDSFSSQILGVYISVPSSKPTWYTGAWINQLVKTNLIDSSASWNSFSQRLSLGGNIVIFPTDFASYQLKFSFPVYFQNAFISIWAYIGQM